MRNFWRTTVLGLVFALLSGAAMPARSQDDIMKRLPGTWVSDMPAKDHVAFYYLAPGSLGVSLPGGRGVIGPSNGEYGSNFAIQGETFKCLYLIIPAGRDRMIWTLMSQTGLCLPSAAFERVHLPDDRPKAEDAPKPPPAVIPRPAPERAPEPPVIKRRAGVCGWYAIYYCSRVRGVADDYSAQQNAETIDTSDPAYPKFARGWYCSAFGPMEKGRASARAASLRQRGYSTAYIKNPCE